MRVISEGIKEAHENVKKYGGVWYVLNDAFFSVVKESYFIEEDGTLKNKPFYSLYNTKDCMYGALGHYNKLAVVDGLINYVLMTEEECDSYEQPYGL